MSRKSSPILKFGRIVAFTLVALALLAFIGYFIVYNIYAYSLFRFPFDYDQGEGFELVDTILFSRFEWPYRNNDNFPFYSSNYPPVFHLVIVPLVWIFGPKYWTGRLVSYLGTLVTAAVIGYAVQREGKRWWLSVICGLGYLASNYIYHVGPLFRQHLFMVMFETMAVVLVARIVAKEEATGRENNPGLLVVMLLLLLAGYTKQLAYATVISVFGFLFLRNWQRALQLAIPFALATGAIFFAINFATGGEWYTATVTANINEFIPGQSAGLFRQWFLLHRIFVLVAICVVVFELYFDRLSAYSIWFVFATINSLTAGKWGAGESYFATAIAASCILTGIGFGRMLNLAKKMPPIAYPITVSIIALLFLNQADRVFHMPTHTPLLRNIATLLNKPTLTYIPPQTSCSSRQPQQIIPYVDTVGPSLLGRPPSQADREAGDRIITLLGEGGLVFSEEAAFNLWAGRPVVTNPTQLLNLYKNNVVDLSEMITMIDDKAFSRVLLRGQLYPPPVLFAIGQNYTNIAQVQMNGFVYCILAPNG